MIRLKNFDYLRIILAIIVVLLHSHVSNGNEYNFLGDVVIFFFFISGYSNYISWKDLPYWKYINARIFKMLITIFSVAIIFDIIYILGLNYIFGIKNNSLVNYHFVNVFYELIVRFFSIFIPWLNNIINTYSNQLSTICGTPDGWGNQCKAFPPLWSLVPEFTFYFLTPFIIWGMKKLDNVNKNLKYIVYIICLLVINYLTLGGSDISHKIHNGGSPYELNIYMQEHNWIFRQILSSNLMYYVSGMIFASLYKEHYQTIIRLIKKYKNIFKLIWYILLVMIINLEYYYFLNRYLQIKSVTYFWPAYSYVHNLFLSSIVQVIELFVWSIIFSLCYLSFAINKKPKTTRNLGNITLLIYIIHPSIIKVLRVPNILSIYNNISTPSYVYIWQISIVIVTIIIAYLLDTLLLKTIWNRKNK